MNEDLVRLIAGDIAHDFVKEVERTSPPAKPGSATIVDLLLRELADKVATLLGDLTPIGTVRSTRVEAALQKAESKLEKAAARASGADEGEARVAESSLPNLKYAKPKYNNVESILKYVEAEDDKRGVKLIIMNFND